MYILICMHNIIIEIVRSSNVVGRAIIEIFCTCL